MLARKNGRSTSGHHRFFIQPARLAVALLLALSMWLPPSAAAQQHAVIWGSDTDAATQSQTSSRSRPAGPTTAPVDATRPPRVSRDLRRASSQVVSPQMVDVAQKMLNRLLKGVSRGASFKAKQEAIRAFRPTSAEMKEASGQGFKSLTIEAGGGGNSPYLVGASITQGVAFSLTPGIAPRLINSGGFSLGVPGAEGDIRLGLWKSPADDLASWSMGVNASFISGKGVGIGGGVFWSVGTKPTFQGFNIGAAVGKAGPSADAGFAWTEYTGQILNTTEDTFRVLTLRETRHGAEIGGSCKVGPDCKGYNAPVGSPNAGTACCRGVCTRTKKDYLGVSWCPHVCRKGPFAGAGSC